MGGLGGHAGGRAGTDSSPLPPVHSNTQEREGSWGGQCRPRGAPPDPSPGHRPAVLHPPASPRQPGRGQPLLQDQEVEAGEHPAGVQPGHQRWGSARALGGRAGWVGMCGWGAGGAGWVCPPSPALRPPGSPKRRQFQRQRAASESMDQEDRDPHQTDIIQYIAHTDDVAFHPAGGPFLPSPASPPPSLGRYFSVDKRGRGWVSRAPGKHRETPRCPGRGGLAPLRLRWDNRVWGEGSGGGR